MAAPDTGIIFERDVLAPHLVVILHASLMLSFARALFILRQHNIERNITIFFIFSLHSIAEFKRPFGLGKNSLLERCGKYDKMYTIVNGL